MDWSLVLASQGVEVSIERPVGGDRWLLVVPRADHARALEAIRTFRLENRRWAWRQQVPGSELKFHWGVIVWVLVLSWLHLLSGRLHAPGALVTESFRQGEWWRLFTAVWLHADLGHLASNALLGALVLGLAMARYGAGLGMLLSFLAGVAGNVAGVWLRLGNFAPGPFRPGEDYIGVGASGMVMGAIGLLASQGMALWRLSRHGARAALLGLMAGSFLFLTFGSAPGSDLVAHAGGFIAGAFLGSIATLLHLERWNRAAAALFAIVAVVPWLLTLRS